MAHPTVSAVHSQYLFAFAGKKFGLVGLPDFPKYSKDDISYLAEQLPVKVKTDFIKVSIGGWVGGRGGCVGGWVGGWVGGCV